LQSALSTGDSNRGRTSGGIDRNTLRSLSLRLLKAWSMARIPTPQRMSAADKTKDRHDATQSRCAYGACSHRACISVKPSDRPAIARCQPRPMIDLDRRRQSCNQLAAI
jgi:hypothetical protein